jgi:chemotaxis protein CheX
MDKKFIEYIKKVVNDIFSTMVFLNPVQGEPINREDNDNPIPNKKDVTGIIGLGGTITASIIVHFEKNSALRVTSNMLGIPYQEIDGDVRDAVGEITNMIAGGIKVELASTGIELDQSLPVVVSGSDFDTSCLSGGDSVLINIKLYFWLYIFTCI